MTYFDRLKKARTDKGLTQRKLAEAAGIAPGSLASYEKGTKAPPVDVAYRLASALNVSLDWLFDDQATMDESGKKARSYGDIARAIIQLCQMGVGFGISLKAESIFWVTEPQDPLDGYITKEEYEEEIKERPDAYFWGDKGAVGHIKIICRPIGDFVDAYAKLLNLYMEKTVDEEMLSAWLDKKLEELDKKPVLWE